MVPRSVPKSRGKFNDTSLAIPDCAASVPHDIPRHASAVTSAGLIVPRTPPRRLLHCIRRITLPFALFDRGAFVVVFFALG